MLEAIKAKPSGGAQVRGLDGFCARKETLGMVRMSWSGHQEKIAVPRPVPLTRPPAIKERSLTEGGTEAAVDPEQPPLFGMKRITMRFEPLLPAYTDTKTPIQ